MASLSFTDLEQILGTSCSYKGNTSLIFNGFKPILECSRGDISWIRPNVQKAAYYINNTKAGGIICDEGIFAQFLGNPTNSLFIITPNPLLAFVKILNTVKDPEVDEDEPPVHPTAVIHPDCKLGKGVKVGAYSILDNCTIGDNTIISNNVRIYGNAIIGQKCVIREFCSIGGAGFGIVQDENGDNIHIPHIGDTVIGDNVLIFPYTNIDRGTLGNTVVENNVVIDHYCHIGHNTFTGKNTIITAGVVLAGGSRIGNNCFLGVKTIVKEKAEIGAYVTTGMGAVVVSNIPDKETWVGNPATEISAFTAQRNFLKKNGQV